MLHHTAHEAYDSDEPDKLLAFDGLINLRNIKIVCVCVEMVHCARDVGVSTTGCYLIDAFKRLKNSEKKNDASKHRLNTSRSGLKFR